MGSVLYTRVTIKTMKWTIVLFVAMVLVQAEAKPALVSTALAAGKGAYLVGTDSGQRTVASGWNRGRDKIEGYWNRTSQNMDHRTAFEVPWLEGLPEPGTRPLEGSRMDGTAGQNFGRCFGDIHQQREFTSGPYIRYSYEFGFFLYCNSIPQFVFFDAIENILEI